MLCDLLDDLRGASGLTRPVVLGEIGSQEKPAVQRGPPAGAAGRVDDV
jgi:hypothetical protein